MIRISFEFLCKVFNTYLNLRTAYDYFQQDDVRQLLAFSAVASVLALISTFFPEW